MEQRPKLQEEAEGDDKSDNQSDDTESVSSVEDVALNKAYSVELPVHASILQSLVNVLVIILSLLAIYFGLLYIYILIIYYFFVLSQFNSLMELFSGSRLEIKIMSKVGCLDYSVTPWEMVQPNAFKRQVSYKFNRYMSIFGSEVVSTQLKLPSSIGNGWIINDDMSLHNVPFGDHFKVLGVSEKYFFRKVLLPS